MSDKLQFVVYDWFDARVRLRQTEVCRTSNSPPVVVAQTCRLLLCAQAAQTRTLRASRLASSGNSGSAAATLSAIRVPANSTDSLMRFSRNASTRPDKSAEPSSPHQVSMRPPSITRAALATTSGLPDKCDSVAACPCNRARIAAGTLD